MTRFGVLLFTHRFPGRTDGDVLGTTLDIAARADALGLDDLWTTEHHFISYGVNPSALTLAAHLLGRTTRMRVGTAVTILPTHSPVAIAEQTALLDQISGGRFDLGIGRGGPVVDYEALGRSLDDWRTGLPESLDVLLGAFSGKVAGTGEHHRFREVAPAPRPLTTPHPPVYVAASSEKNVDLAAAHDLPMLFFILQGPEAIAPLVARHAEATARPAESWAHGSAIVAQVTGTEAQARDHVMNRVMPFFGHAFSEYVMLEERDSNEPPPEQMGELMLASEAIGPVDLCVERVAARLSVPGVSRLLLHVESSGTREGALANLERVVTDVLPRVRARLAAGEESS
ncbi:MAG: hypothetical protein ABS81_01965 [Pseudonocardia sp. SCN 72-86]|nr:MAG: hypothetical protein ABS81_01965 [Pseudonocardia sp. SCN 72-86]